MKAPILSIRVVREGTATYPATPPLRESHAAANLFRSLIPDDDREHFWVLLLDTRNRLIAAHSISTGSLTASLVHPRESFRLAVHLAASAAIFGHNHPSGDPTPSREDASLTTRLFDAGKLLGIRVLDNLVVTHANTHHYSFADDDSLPPATS